MNDMLESPTKARLHPWFLPADDGFHDPELIPMELQGSMPGAQLVLSEWKRYRLKIPGATSLWVNNVQQVYEFEQGYFTLEFKNRLGPSILRPVGPGSDFAPLRVEVIASKFKSVEESLQFTSSIVDTLAARVSTLPFVIQAETARQMQRAHREPNRFFAFFFFRHHGDALIRALQIITADPHRKLDTIVEDLRIHQARNVDAEALHSLLVGPRAGVPNLSPSATALERLQPQRIRQRRPEETYNTPVNRFVVAVCQRIRHTLQAVEAAWWFEREAMAEDRARFERMRRAIKLLLLSDRFSNVPPSLRLPSYSRVLQNRHGYRELMIFWNGLTQVHQPVLAELDRAVDQRDVPTLYEYWLFFELAAAIEQHTGIPAEYPGVMDPYVSQVRLKARFDGIGTLSAQTNYDGSAVYSGITLRPDFVWETKSGRRVVLDAKFAMNSVSDLLVEDDAAAEYRATSRDIAKMHAYRDAIAGVDAAFVLYPGTEGRFWGADRGMRSVSNLQEILPVLLLGEMSGIGAIPVKPMGGL